jgi:phage terminase large subunit-like protein
MSELVDEALAQERGDLDDPTFYGRVFALPDKADWRDEANWHLANPALGKFKDIEHMRSLAAKAKRSPSAEASFRALELNQRVDSIEGLVTSADWKACQKEAGLEELKGHPLYCALDLSGRQDLTAFAMVWYLGDGRAALKSFFWTPKDELAERSKRDGAKYIEWERKGFLRALPGRVVDYGAVVGMVQALLHGQDLRSLAYDKWRINDFKTEMERAGVPPDAWPMTEFGQSFKDMSPAVEKLEAMVIAHTLAHDGNPVMTYCMSNVRIIKDASDNRRFDKRKKYRRIDGAVAAAMALRTMDIAEKVEVDGPSVYESRGLLVL